MYVHATCVNKHCFSFVNLSFGSLIYRVQVREPMSIEKKSVLLCFAFVFVLSPLQVSHRMNGMWLQGNGKGEG